VRGGAALQKAEECLKLEEQRVESYLHLTTKPKLLSKVEAELLSKYEEQLLTKEHSGCAALLRDDKVRAPPPLQGAAPKEHGGAPLCTPPCSTQRHLLRARGPEPAMAGMQRAEKHLCHTCQCHRSAPAYARRSEALLFQLHK
jgi:hypothetical protein